MSIASAILAAITARRECFDATAPKAANDTFGAANIDRA
jgi:hypothetical protein